MNTVNRALLIARPKEPFVEWVAAQAELTVEEARAELDEARPGYLIPTYTPENELDTMLDELREEIFSCECELWSGDEASWPQDRSLAAFKRCFDVDLHPVVLDLGIDDFNVKAECGEIGS
jgi:hypothetical protein